MKSVKKLGYKLNSKATLGRNLVLLIDNKPFIEILEDLIPTENNGMIWTEKKDAKFLTKNLKKSISKPGEFNFLTCAHCNYPQDILMSAIKVAHKGDCIIWTIKPPGADIYFEKYNCLILKFHRPQYEKVIASIFKKKMNKC